MNIENLTMDEKIELLDEFRGSKTQKRIDELTGMFKNKSKGTLPAHRFVDENFLKLAIDIKKASAEIDVIVQTVGTLTILDKILDEDEVVYNFSLGASKKGDFTLETSKRLAVFKFIHWKGNDAMRQASLFMEFVKLADYKDNRKKEIYVIDITHPLAFLSKSSRSVTKALFKNKSNLLIDFKQRHPECATVPQFYNKYKDTVKIKDMLDYLPNIG